MNLCIYFKIKLNGPIRITISQCTWLKRRLKKGRVVALIQKDRFAKPRHCFNYARILTRGGGREGVGTWHISWIMAAPCVWFTVDFVHRRMCRRLFAESSNMCKCTLYFLSSRFLSHDARMQELRLPSKRQNGY